MLHKFKVAICPTNKTCAKCGKIANYIAVNRGSRTSLFCLNCGYYQRHAGKPEVRLMYVEEMELDDTKTPIRVIRLARESMQTTVN